MKKTLIAAFSAALIMMSSCQSASQFYGVATGASVGGMFGSAIGAISGGWRGSNVGRLAGMAIGGVVGAAATAPKTTKESRTSDYHNGYDYDDYRQNNSYSPYSDIIIENIRRANKAGYGFNAYSEEYVDMIPAGIVDPTKVTRSALENAASVAAMVLTTESLVTDIKEPAPSAPAMPAGGMDY